MVPRGQRNVPRAQTPSSSISSSRSGHVAHATAEAAAGHRVESHPNLFVFAIQRWRQSVREGEVLLVLLSQ